MAILGQSAQVVTVLDVAINSDGVPARAQDVVVREDAYPSTSSNSTKPDNSSHPATIVVAKVPIWGLHEDDPVERLRRLQRQFNPHATLLFVRHPVDNLASLNKHRLSKRTHNRGYALSHGDPDSKLQALEKLWKRRQELFSEVIYYPELFLDRANVVGRLRSLRRPGEVVPSIGLPITHCNFCCLNAVRDLVADTKDRLRFRVAWGGGGISHLSPAGAYRKGSREKDLIDEVRSEPRDAPRLRPERKEPIEGEKTKGPVLGNCDPRRHKQRRLYSGLAAAERSRSVPRRNGACLIRAKTRRGLRWLLTVRGSGCASARRHAKQEAARLSRWH